MDAAHPSFSREVKQEIASHAWSEESLRSLLSGFIKNNGHLHVSGGLETLELSSDDAKIAKAIYSAIHELFGIEVRFAYTRGLRFQKRVRYHVLIDNPEYLLGDLEIDFLEGKIPHNVVATPELAAAYIAGSFLSSGSVNSPASSNYHLEVSFSEMNYAKWWNHLLLRVQGHQFLSKLAKRRDRYIVYLKRSDQISDFLVYVGAPESCLKFEDVRVDRDFANIGNRLQNLDLANVSKTLISSRRQIEEIKDYVSRHGWAGVDNPKLKALMKLRLDHEDATLTELADLLSQEFATTISRSNVNHLFRYLHAEYLKNHEEQP